MKEENGKIFLQWILPLLCTGVLVSIMFFWFFVNIRSDARDDVCKDLTEDAQGYARKTDQELASITSAGKTAAVVINSQHMSGNEIVTQLLEALVQETGAYETVYCNADQECVNQSGESAGYATSDAETGTVQIENGIMYTYLESGGEQGKPSMKIQIPVSEEGDSLILYYPVELLQAKIKVENMYDELTFAALIDVQGDILLKAGTESEFLAGSNLWDQMGDTYENAIAKARVRIQNGSTGYLEATVGEEDRTLAYAVTGIGTWTLVLGIEQDYVDKLKEAQTREIGKMLYQLLVVFILSYVTLFAINMIGKKRNEEKSRELQEKADMDLLTGLNNKLATERKIKEYMNKNPNALAMMFVLDIDNFKKINDTMGHAFGDEVLRSFGKHISANFRVTDIIGRTGGDEFTIFLKDLKDEAVVAREAEKLVLFFKNFQVGEYVKYSATASIGAAVFPADGKDFDALYKSADHALYKAKKRGKNQLAFFDEEQKN